ncbi:hypothetical protein BJX65DRAFT_307863 [Aspergillus insuetus]
MPSERGQFTFEAQCLSLVDTCKNEGRNLVIFVGPGISKSSPSNIPDWLQLNKFLLHALKTSALEIQDLSPDVRGLINGLELEPSLAFAFSKLLVETVEGHVDPHLPAEGVLNGTEVNSKHAALVSLARHGIVRDIVTTNLDTMIETAFHHADVPLKTYTTKEDYQSVSSETGSACSLYKLHGSGLCVSTLRDVVSQKMAELPLYVRARLGSLFQKHHVLVVGFSYQDLEFGGDYFALRTTRYAKQGLTWMLEGGEDSSAIEAAPIYAEHRPRLIQKLMVERDGVHDTVIKADFLQFCNCINIETGAVNDTDSSQARADDCILGAIQEWFRQLGVHSLSSASACSQFLRYCGKERQSNKVNETLKSFLNDVALDNLSNARLAMTLVQHITNDVHLGLVEGWCTFALALASRVVSVPPHGLANAWNRVRLTAWSKLAWVYKLREQQDSALHALCQAKRFAAALGESEMLGSLLFEEGGLHQDLELRLESSRQARLILPNERSPLVFWSYRDEADALIHLSEYDAALAALTEARRLVPYANTPRMGAGNLRILEAKVMLRRGDASGGYLHVKNALPELDARPSLAAQIRVHLLQTFQTVASLREELIFDIDWIFHAMEERGVLWMLDRYPLPSRIRLSALRSRLQNGPDSSENDLLQSLECPRSGIGDAADDWRRDIVRHEYRRELTLLPPCFDNLSNQQHEGQSPWRFYDLAKALTSASDRAGDCFLHQKGLQYQSIGIGQLGDTWKEIQALNDILQETNHSEDEHILCLRACMYRNLGTAFSRIDNRHGVEDNFSKAITLHRNWNQAMESLQDVLDNVDAWIRLGDHNAALAVLDSEEDCLSHVNDPEIAQKWQLARNILFQSHHCTAIPPPVLTLHGTSYFDIQAIYDQQPYVESAEDLRLLALEASRSCHHDVAATMSLQAQHDFSRKGDILGAARCIQDRSEIAAAQGCWGSARDLGMWALNLQRQLGHIGGRIQGGALTALCLFRLGMFEEASKEAEDILEQAVNHVPSRFILIAWWVYVNALGQDDVKLDAIRAFLDQYAADDDNEVLTVLRATLQEQLARLDPSSAGGAHDGLHNQETNETD